MDYELLANGKVQIGMEAPNFICDSTEGKIDFSRKDDKWFVLLSYKEDFCNITTKELISIERFRYIFNSLNVVIIAMSTGNLLSHLAWKNEIYRTTGINILTPIIEDQIGEISRKYGMISKVNEKNIVMNNVIIVDDKNIVRANLQYLPEIERNFLEIIRIIKQSKQNN